MNVYLARETKKPGCVSKRTCGACLKGRLVCEVMTGLKKNQHTTCKGERRAPHRLQQLCCLAPMPKLTGSTHASKMAKIIGRLLLARPRQHQPSHCTQTVKKKKGGETNIEKRRFYQGSFTRVTESAHCVCLFRRWMNDLSPLFFF